MHKIKWIVQSNLFGEEAVTRLVDCLERMEFDYDLVKVIPFGGGVEPEVENNGQPVVVIGSISLVNHARKKGWFPGAWSNPKIYNFRHYLEQYGDKMLNYGGKIGTLRYVYSMVKEEKVFIRPLADDKSFAGAVMSDYDIDEWRNRLVNAEKGWTVDLDTEILVAPLKTIWSETRFVCQCDRICSGSQYKRGNRVLYSEVVDNHISDFAKSCIHPFTFGKPLDTMYVMDIADTPEGPKIIEFNNVNSAGWYECDIPSILSGFITAVNIEMRNIGYAA